MTPLHPKKGFQALLIASYLLSTPSCAQENQKSKPSRPLAAEKTAAKLTKIQWNSEKKALRKAKAANKPVLLYFGADWCLPCKELEVNTFPDPSVLKYIQENFISSKVDGTELDAQTQKIFKKYKITTLPRILFLTSAGDRIEVQIPKFLPPKEFLEALRKAQKAVNQKTMSQ